MAVLLKVNTDVMQSLAQDLNGEVVNIRNGFQEIQTTMTNTGNYWRGDAADTDRKGFSSLQSQIEELLKELERQPSKLCEIAGIMMETEKSNTEMTLSLSKEEFV